MHAFRFMVPVALLTTLWGCAAPTVQYTKLQPGAAGQTTSNQPLNPQGWQKFRFAHSTLVIAQDTGGVSASAVLIDSPLDVYYTAHGSSSTWGVKTDIGFKYKTNTQLLDTADVSMQDNRIKLIDSAASIATTVLPLLGGSGPGVAPAAFPMRMVMDDYLAPQSPSGCTDDLNSVRTCEKIPGPNASTISLTIYPAAPDAISIDAFDAGHLNTNESVLYYASCRDVVVNLTPGPAPASTSDTATTPAAAQMAKDQQAPTKTAKGAAPANGSPNKHPPPVPPVGAQAPVATSTTDQTQAQSGPVKGFTSTVRVADARYLEAIGLPAKGVVSFRNDCGAEVSSQAPGISSSTEVAAEVVKQAKAVYDAETAAKAAKAKAAAAAKPPAKP
ncbi:hypothetical protein [Variovorax sp. dw_954]|uniref:hypothetical protein n=1 Tax=Variovorax sp. dw_954 TaxID=2720078 RepID=UPI001BD5E4C1|nr:hypothetical protein [Variovorax sp. dw_954]